MAWECWTPEPSLQTDTYVLRLATEKLALLSPWGEMGNPTSKAEVPVRQAAKPASMSLDANAATGWRRRSHCIKSEASPAMQATEGAC